jgi:hypothetical protein
MNTHARKRRICWPNPDQVCLQGGCVLCQDEVLVSLDNIRVYAVRKGWLYDYRYGLGNLGLPHD